MARKASKKDREAATAMAAAMASQMPEAMARLGSGSGEFAEAEVGAGPLVTEGASLTEREEALFEMPAPAQASSIARSLDEDDSTLTLEEALAGPLPGDPYPEGAITEAGQEPERYDLDPDVPAFSGDIAEGLAGEPEYEDGLPDEWHQAGLFPPASVKGELRYINLTRLPSNTELGPKAPDKGMLDSIREMGVVTPIVVVMRPPWATSDLGDTAAAVSPFAEGTHYSQFRVGDGVRRIKALRLVAEEFAERQAKGKEWAHAAPSTTIPAMVYDADMLNPTVAAIVGNEQRSDNAPAILQAVERLLIEGHDPEAVRGVTGWTKPVWARRTALLGLPRILLEGYYQGKIADTVAAQVAKLPQARRTALADIFRETGKLTADSVREVRSVAHQGVQTSLASSLFSRAMPMPTETETNWQAVAQEYVAEHGEVTAEEIRAANDRAGLARAISRAVDEERGRHGDGEAALPWPARVANMLRDVYKLIPEEHHALRNQVDGALRGAERIVTRMAVEAGERKLDLGQGKEVGLAPDPQGFPIEELPD